MTLGQPKTAKSRRTVPLTARAVVALKAHRKRQLEERIRLADLYEDRGLVFANEVGGITNPSNLRQRSFAKIVERAGLPKTTRFHDLRHTCATLLLSRGKHPRPVQELLGHANAHHPRHLQPRPAGHERRTGRRDGRRPRGRMIVGGVRGVSIGAGPRPSPY